MSEDKPNEGGAVPMFVSRDDQKTARMCACGRSLDRCVCGREINWPDNDPTSYRRGGFAVLDSCWDVLKLYGLADDINTDLCRRIANASGILLV